MHGAHIQTQVHMHTLKVFVKRGGGQLSQSTLVCTPLYPADLGKLLNPSGSQ